MPISAIGNVNIAIGPVRVGDFIDFYMCRQDVHNNCVIESYNTCAQLFSPDKLAVCRVHCEEIALNPDNAALVSFHRPGKMTLGILTKKLSMNDVNVFACVKDHDLVKTSALLFSGTCFKIFLQLSCLRGRQICSDSHMPENRLPLGGGKFTRIARHMAAAAIHCPQLDSGERLGLD